MAKCRFITKHPAVVLPPLGSAENPFTSTAQLRANVDTPAKSGIYDFYCANNDTTYQLAIDGSEGGGWIIIYNLLRPINNNTAPILATPNPFPLRDFSKSLGDDGTVGNEWGVADNVDAVPCVAAEGGITEMRHRAETTNHGRIIDFKVSDQRIFDVSLTSGGALSTNWTFLMDPPGVNNVIPTALAATTTLLPDHTANLPANANFYNIPPTGNAVSGYWGMQVGYLKGGAGPDFSLAMFRGGDRWEVDDAPNVLFSDASTWGQIMIRA